MTAWLRECGAYWSAGGPLLLPIAAVCFGIWAVFARLRETLQRLLREAEQARGRLETAGTATDADALAARLEPCRGGVAALLREALADIARGAQPVAAFETRETACTASVRRELLVLAALTAAAPLLGLLGTVTGMIDTFEAVAGAYGETGGRVAAGISRALITTQFGLVVALPGVFGVARIRRLLRHADVRLAQCRTAALTLLRL